MSRNRISELKKSLYMDFYNTWCHIHSLQRGTPMSAITRMAINSQSPCWYVPYRTAKREFDKIKRNGEDCYKCPSPIKQAMYIVLYRIVSEEMQRSKCNELTAFRLIVEQPAPCFFISSRTARNIIRTMIHSHRKQ